MFKDELKQYVATSGLVNMKECGNNMFVLKYKKKVFYNNLWNKFLEECRGTIVDADFNLVSYPFRKIYNYGVEADAPVLADNTQITAHRKVNGFMAAVTVHNGELLVSTTGSTNSEFVDYAKEMMITHAPLADWLKILGTNFCRDLTAMFECVHPSDPHIVPEQSGMYLLGYREKVWGSQVGHNPVVLQDLAKRLNCYVPDCCTVTVAQLKQMVKDCRYEGYVAYTVDGAAFKIKSPYYLTSKWVARNPKTDKLVDLKNDIKHHIDEEYYRLIDKIRENIVQYTEMDEQTRLAWVRKQLEMV